MPFDGSGRHRFHREAPSIDQPENHARGAAQHEETPEDSCRRNAYPGKDEPGFDSLSGRRPPHAL